MVSLSFARLAGVLGYEKMTSVILLARRIARRGIRISNFQFL